MFLVYAEQISYHISSIFINEYATFWQKGELSEKKNNKKSSQVNEKEYFHWTLRVLFNETPNN